VSSRQHAVKDRELNSIVRLPAPARDAWCQRRHADLEARGALPKLSPEVRGVLVWANNRYTWTGDVRG
jgi:hypothetical protein